MSLIDSASLIVTPNGYKEGKLYSVIPSDGSGDMSVVRATTATRVNSAGLVELVPYNLLQYSEQLDNAYWSTQDATITANTTTAPNGTLTADTFTRTANTGFLYSTNPFALITGSYAISVYAKANAISSFRLDLGTSGFSQGTTCTFDLSNGTAGTPTVYGSTTSVVASIENVGNGWYRCSLSANFIAGNYYAELAITTTGSIYAWGFQLVEGSSALPYQKTETRLNIPRLDYSNGTCPSLLVEPQRTNLLTYSSSFDNAAWTNGDSSISANNITSPSGVQDADLLTENTANNAHVIYRSDAGTSNTFSFYAKPNGRNWLGVLSNNGDVTFFDIANGDLGTVAATSTATIEDAGNGWYRCTVYNTHPTFGASIYLSTGNGITDYLGNGTSGAYIWGAQMELGSYPTSYIPTQAATVTRNADVISKTGIADLIGQTEGTIFVEFNNDNNINASIARIIALSDGTANNRLYLAKLLSGASYFVSVTSGTQTGEITGAIMPQGIVKIALAYNANDVVMYVNGSLVGSDLFHTTPATSNLYLGQENLGTASLCKPYNAVALYKTRLTNAELATLTTI